jgi:hypothetical protein
MKTVVPALALGLLAALPVRAQVVADADVVRAFLEAYGLRVTSETDSSGDPVLSSRVEGTGFKVFFYGCDGGQCESIQFSTAFDLDRPLTAAKVNEWNRDKRYGKAYIDDEGDPFIDMDVNLDFDGVGAKNFDDTIDLWRAVLSDFRDYIDW